MTTHIKTTYHIMRSNLLHLFVLTTALSVLTACQHLPKHTTQATHHLPSAQAPTAFKITGKIGIVYYDAQHQKRSGSAFFAWAQQGKRFAIDLSGALGIGKTYIEGTSTYAKLINQTTGEITAATPEAVLLKATGWNAPVSLLPHWIMGQATPNATQLRYDDKKRLTQTQAGRWYATLYYRDQATVPYKLVVKEKSLTAAIDTTDANTTGNDTANNNATKNNATGKHYNTKVVISLQTRAHD